jgi:F0F1-type ATP synthase assembly protein I
VDRQSERQKLTQGFSEVFSRAVEFVATPVLFALFGNWLDHRIHTGHLLLVVLAAFAIVGMSLRTFFAYSETMKAEEAKGPWAKS